MLNFVPFCCLTFRNKAVLWFFFDLMWLLFALGLVSVTVGTWWSALRCERSVDTVCRQMPLLQQQVHCLRVEMINLVLLASWRKLNSLSARSSW